MLAEPKRVIVILRLSEAGRELVGVQRAQLDVTRRRVCPTRPASYCVECVNQVSPKNHCVPAATTRLFVQP